MTRFAVGAEEPVRVIVLPNVIEVAEGIPFADLTQGSHDRLYALKGEVVARGVKAITGVELPVFHKRRFQHGAPSAKSAASLFPTSPSAYRRAFHALYEG